MTKFIIKGKVKYQGKLYNSGEVVEVAKEDVPEFKAHGWEIVEGKEPKEPKEPDLTKLKNDELRALLKEKGIEFKEDAKKAELIALLEVK